jgi:hypothetical protein
MTRVGFSTAHLPNLFAAELVLTLQQGWVLCQKQWMNFFPELVLLEPQTWKHPLPLQQQQ